MIHVALILMRVEQHRSVYLEYYGCLELIECFDQEVPAGMKYRDEYRDDQNGQSVAMSEYRDDQNDQSVATNECHDDRNEYHDDQNAAMSDENHGDRNEAMSDENHDDQNDQSVLQVTCRDESRDMHYMDLMSHNLKCLECGLNTLRQHRPLVSLDRHD